MPKAELQQHPTPSEAISAIARFLPDPSGRLWLDPCVGDGAIPRTLAVDAAIQPEWILCDIDIEYPDLSGNHVCDHYQGFDFLADDFAGCGLEDVDVCVMNPPWWTLKAWVGPRGETWTTHNIALLFVERVWELCPKAEVWMLHATRLWDGVGKHDGVPRSTWLKHHWPDMFPIGVRLPFMGDDGGKYAGPVSWYRWRVQDRYRLNERCLLC